MRVSISCFESTKRGETSGPQTSLENDSRVMNLHARRGSIRVFVSSMKGAAAADISRVYIRTRFKVEALNQGPACFGWRLTNEPMTTSPSLARFSRTPLFHLAPTLVNKTIIYSSARERAQTGSGRIERILYAAAPFRGPRHGTMIEPEGEMRRRRVRSGGGVGEGGEGVVKEERGAS